MKQDANENRPSTTLIIQKSNIDIENAEEVNIGFTE